MRDYWHSGICRDNGCNQETYEGEQCPSGRSANAGSGMQRLCHGRADIAGESVGVRKSRGHAFECGGGVGGFGGSG